MGTTNSDPNRPLATLNDSIVCPRQLNFLCKMDSERSRLHAERFAMPVNLKDKLIDSIMPIYNRIDPEPSRAIYVEDLSVAVRWIRIRYGLKDAPIWDVCSWVSAHGWWFQTCGVDSCLYYDPSDFLINGKKIRAVTNPIADE